MARVSLEFDGQNRGAVSAAQGTVDALDKVKRAGAETAAAAGTSATRQTSALGRIVSAYKQVATEGTRSSRDLVAANRAAESSARSLSGVHAAYRTEVRKSEQETGQLTRGMLAAADVSGELRRALLLGSTGFLGAYGFTAAVKGGVEAASELEKQLQRTTKTFGDSSDGIKEWSEKSATALGIARSEALDAVNTIGTLLANTGVAPAKVAPMSKAIVQLASDMAAFKGVKPEDALAALEAGLQGRTRTLKQFGIVLDQTTIKEEAYRDGIAKAKVNEQALQAAEEKANLALHTYDQAVEKHGKTSAQAASAQLTLQKAEAGVTKERSGSFAALTAEQRALATYNAIVAQTVNQQGAWKARSHDLAQQEQILHAQLKDLDEEFGTALIPMLERYIPLITQWIAKNQANGNLQRDINKAVHDGGEILSGVVWIAKEAIQVFDRISASVGGEKHAVELLAAAWLEYKAITKGIALYKFAQNIGLIGSSALKSAKEVGALQTAVTWEKDAVTGGMVAVVGEESAIAGGATTAAAEVGGLRAALLGLGGGPVLAAIAAAAAALYELKTGLPDNLPATVGSGVPKSINGHKGYGDASKSMAYDLGHGEMIQWDAATGSWSVYSTHGVMATTPTPVTNAQAAKLLGVTQAGLKSSFPQPLPNPFTTTNAGYAGFIGMSKNAQTQSLMAMTASAAQTYGVPEQLFLAQIKQESGFNQHAVSKAGAEGIAQFMPATAKGFGIDPMNPSQALPAAAKMMARLFNKYGSWPLALAAYNAGEGTVDRYLAGKGTLPKETRSYVASITSAAGLPGDIPTYGSMPPIPKSGYTPTDNFTDQAKKKAKTTPLQRAIAGYRKQAANVQGAISVDLGKGRLSSGVAGDLGAEVKAAIAQLKGATTSDLPRIKASFADLSKDVSEGLDQAVDVKKVKAGLATFNKTVAGSSITPELKKTIAKQAADLNHLLSSGLADPSKVKAGMANLGATIKRAEKAATDSNQLKQDMAGIRSDLANGLLTPKLANDLLARARQVNKQLGKDITDPKAFKADEATKSQIEANVKELVDQLNIVKKNKAALQQIRTDFSASLDETLGLPVEHASVSTAEKAQQASKKIMDELSTGLVTGATKTRLEAQLQQYQQVIQDGLDGVMQTVQRSQSAFENVWSRISDGALSQFDKETQDHLSQMQKSAAAAIQALQVTVQGSGFASFLFGGSVAQTPTEQLIAQMQAAKQTADDAQSVADAQQQLAQAQQALASAGAGTPGTPGTSDFVLSELESSGILVSGQIPGTAGTAGTSGDDLQSLQQAVVDAQRQLDDALYQQKLDDLQKTADLERTAADQQLSDAQQAAQDREDAAEQSYEDARDRQRQALQDLLTDAQTQLEQGKTTLATVAGEIGDALGGGLSDSFSAYFDPDNPDGAYATLAAFLAAVAQASKLAGIPNPTGGGGGSGGGGSNAPDLTTVQGVLAAAKAGTGPAPGSVAEGRLLTGFASGGWADRGLPVIDPRDTIPALLRRGEYVMSPEEVAAGRPRWAGDGGGDLHVHLTLPGATFYGTPRRTAIRQLSRSLAPELKQIVSLR